MSETLEVKTPVKIPVPRERYPEIYKFADRYVHPERVMSVDQYVMRVRNVFPHDLVVLLYDPEMCDVIYEEYFDTECEIDTEKISEEFWDVLEESQEFRSLVKNLNVNLWKVEFEDYEVVIDNKIVVEPWINLDEDEYKIYLVVDVREEKSRVE